MKDRPVKRYASTYSGGLDNIPNKFLNKKVGDEKTSQLLNLKNLPRYIPKDISNIMPAMDLLVVLLENLARIIFSICEIEFIPKIIPNQAELNNKKVSYIGITTRP